jgi:hypothetical protein
LVNKIGDGAGLKIDLTILSHLQKKDDIINFVFLASVLCNTSACLKRAILALTNKLGECGLYFLADSLKEASDIGIDRDIKRFTLNYIACHTPHRLPPSSLKIKTKAVY